MVTMPLITPSMLAQNVTTNPVMPPVASPSADSTTSFNASLERQTAVTPVFGQGIPSAPVNAVPATEGDTILGGLERLRSAFSAQESRIADLMNSPLTDTNTLLAMQMEMTNFSILIDMTSKLASKAAQGLDTLMKG